MSFLGNFFFYQAFESIRFFVDNWKKSDHLNTVERYLGDMILKTDNLTEMFKYENYELWNMKIMNQFFVHGPLNMKKKLVCSQLNLNIFLLTVHWIWILFLHMVH